MALLIDAETILAGIEQWLQLETKWGTPIDLDDFQEDLADYTPKMKTASSLNRKKSFYSSDNKAGRYSSKTSVNYVDFSRDLKMPRKIKLFSFISGELLSAESVEEICHDIDDAFKFAEHTLCSATSTVRLTLQPKKKPSIHEVIQCSISTTDLSFDDTVEPSVDVDKYIDEVFDHLHSTLATLNRTADDSSKNTVTNLVKRFTAILKSPELDSGLRRQCGDKFRDLAAFWQGQANRD